MSDRYEAKMKLQETALALTAHELTDYYAVQSGPSHQDYLEEQMANAARDYVAAIHLSDDKPVGWYDDLDPDGTLAFEVLAEMRSEELKRRIQGLEN